MAHFNVTNDFYVTLLSNSSANFFPENTCSDFTVQLSQEIQLTDDYEVGLSEVSYATDLMNVTEKSNQIALELDHYYVNRSDETGFEAEVTKKLVVVTLKEARYGSLQLLSEKINKAFNPFIPGGIFDPHELLVENKTRLQKITADTLITCLNSMSINVSGSYFTSSTKTRKTWRKFYVELRDFTKDFVHLDYEPTDLSSDTSFYNFSLKLSGRLAHQFGFVPSDNLLSFNTSPNDASLRHGSAEEIFIYVDIISAQIVGDTRAKVLKIVKTYDNDAYEKIQSFGKDITPLAVYREFFSPSYLAIEKKRFQKIHVHLADRSGLTIRFPPTALIILKLHFRKKK